MTRRSIQTIELQPGESLQLVVKAAEAAPEPPDPEPPDPPTDWDRIVPPGSYGDITMGTAGERWKFEPGAVVKGRVILAAKDLLIEGLRTTSEQCHETAPQIQKGSSGVCRGFSFEQIGSPGNGMGYSTVSANDDDGPDGGWAGPWTFEDGLADMRDNGHYGFEIWGVSHLTVQRVTFKGKGGRSNGSSRAENGFMSLPRSHDAVIQGCTFDMSQGCYRVIEVAQMRRMQFVENDVLDLVGDVCPMSHEAVGHVIQRNRIRGKGSTPPPNSLLVYLTGSGHTVTDNRLTNVANERQGSASDSTVERNGPNDGPAW